MSGLRDVAKWCCLSFKGKVQEAGERGFGVFLDNTAEPPFFVIQHRSLDPGVANPPYTDTPLNLVCSTVITYCPWCGKELLKWYKRDLSKFSRTDLVIPLS
jgi:hypothetical protein